jgi:hypothetical protein
MLPASAWAQQDLALGLSLSTNDHFGSAAAADGMHALIGAEGDNANTGLVYYFSASGSDPVTYTHVAPPFVPSDLESGDHFGNAIDIFGNIAVIAAERDDVDPDLHDGVDATYADAGSVYVYSFDGTTWQKLVKLTAYDGGISDQFGNAVGVFNDMVIVGSPNHDKGPTTGASDRGGAYIYKKPDTGWGDILMEEDAFKLMASDGQQFDHFGGAVALSSDFAVVGAYGDDNAGEQSGSVYIFHKSGEEWLQTDNFTAPDVTIGDRFGFSVSVDGDHMIIGAPWTGTNDPNVIGIGAAYVYTYNGSDWILETKLSGMSNETGFGHSVSVDGNYAAVGTEDGNAYVYERVADSGSSTGWTWTQLQAINPPDGDGSFSSVDVGSFSSNYVFVGGAPDRSGGSGGAFVDGVFIDPTTAPNIAPTLYAIDDRMLRVGSSTTIDLEADDFETPAADLTFTADFTSTELAPSDLTLTVTGSQLTIDASAVSGSATVTVTVEDTCERTDVTGCEKTDSTSFNLIVGELPVISPVADQSMNQGDTRTVPFTVSFVDSLDSLKITSSDQDVVTSTSLVPVVTTAGEPTGYSFQISPLQSGQAQITIAATAVDGNVVTEDFALTVNSSPQIISLPGSREVLAGTTQVVLDFSVWDAETPTNLTESASFTNTEGVIDETLTPLQIVESQDSLYGRQIVVPLNDTAAAGTSATVTVRLEDPDGAVTTGSTIISLANSNSTTITAIETLNGENKLGLEVVLDEGDPNLQMVLKVGDADAPGIFASATTGNQSWLPNTNIVFRDCSVVSANEFECPFEIVPTAEMTGGSTQVNVTARQSDILSPTASDVDTKSFVFAFNQRPEITSTADAIELQEGGAGTLVEFTISDDDVDNLDFVKTVQVLDPDLLDSQAQNAIGECTDPNNPTGNCWSCTGPSEDTFSCQLNVVPHRDNYGSSAIEIGANDGRVEETFQIPLNVLSVNDAPRIERITFFDEQGNQLAEVDYYDDLGNPNTNPGTVPDMSEDESMEMIVYVNDIDSTDLSLSAGLPEGAAGTLFAEDVQNISIEGNFPTYWFTNPQGEETAVSVVLTPMANEYGTAQIQLTAEDVAGEISERTLSIEVTSVNDPPVIDPIGPMEILEDAQDTVVPVNITEVEGEELTVTASVDAGNTVPLTLTFAESLDATHTFTPVAEETKTLNLKIVPGAGASGNATVRLVAVDALGEEAVETFNVTVLEVNDPPYINDLPSQVVIEEDQQEEIIFTVGDEEGDTLSLEYRWGEPPLDTGELTTPGELTHLAGPDINGKVRLAITPPPDESGEVNIRVLVNDGTNPDVQDHFLLSVTPVNDLPEINPALSDVSINEEETDSKVFTVSDPETPETSLIVTAEWTSIDPADMPAGTFDIIGPDENGITELRTTPPTNWEGLAQITVTVKDAVDGLPVEDDFQLTIIGENDPPILTPRNFDPAETQIVQEDGSKALEFLVEDADTLASLVSVTATDAGTNQDLTLTLPVDCAVDQLDPYQKVCTLTIKPGADQSGSTTLRIEAKDTAGAAATPIEFAVEVEEVNDKPTFKLLNETEPIQMTEDMDKSISFTVQDKETPENITVSFSDWAWQDTGKVGEPRFEFAGTTVRIMTVYPPDDQFGSGIAVLSISDGEDTVQTDLQFDIAPDNDEPILIVNEADIPTTPIEEDTDTPPITFTVSDQETAPEDLNVLVTATWSGSPMPAENIDVDCNDGDCQFVLTPLNNQPQQGSVTVEVTISVTDDENATDSDTVEFEYVAVNDAPTIEMVEPVQRITMEEDAAPVQKEFRVSDPDTNISNIAVSATSSDTNLIPDPFENLFFDDSTGTIRTLTIDPPLHMTGAATITVVAEEIANPDKRSELTFELRVTEIPDQPTITQITINNQPRNQLTINEDEVYGDAGDDPITFEVRDPDTPVEDLLLSYDWEPVRDESFSPTDPGVDGRIRFEGTGEERTITIVPEPNDFGSAEITLMVKDSLESTFVEAPSFMLKVLPVNDEPIVNLPIAGSIDPVTGYKTIYTREGRNVTVKFEADDVETPPSNLTVKAESSNQDLVSFEDVQVLDLTPNEANLNYKVVVQPGTIGEQNYTNISIFAQDDGVPQKSASATFTLRVASTDIQPRISSIADQQINEDGSGTVRFWVCDPKTALDDLNISAVSSDTTLIPNNSLKLTRLDGPSGTCEELGPEINNNYELSITPVPDASGEAVVQVAVDNGQLAAVREFTVNVIEINDLPTISDIRNISGFVGETLYVPFTVDDLETAPSSLTVTPHSSNTNFVPNPPDPAQRLVVQKGQEGERTLVVKPIAIPSSTEITLTVKDENGGTAEEIFTLSSQGIQPGDVNADGSINLTDTIVALQVLAGIGSEELINVFTDADINDDGQIGFAEAFNALRKAATPQ